MEELEGSARGVSLRAAACMLAGDARDPVSGAWRDTKGRGELLQILNGIVSRRLGRSIDLAGGASARGPQAPGP